MQTITDAVSRLSPRLARALQIPAPAAWPERFPGAYLGWGARGPVFTGPEHAALIIGPPRSGKTTSVIIPAVAFWPGPAVVTSTKPDVLNATLRRRSALGTVWVWDPTGSAPVPVPARPARWSPLAGCEDWGVALQRAFTLVGAARPDPRGDAVHWTERASALLASLLHAAATDSLPLGVLMSWIHRRDTLEPLARLDSRPASAAAADLLRGIALADPRETSGAYSTADGVLAAYRHPHTLAGATDPTFDPAAFVAGADTLHLVAPSHSHHQHAPIVCALLDQVRHHVAARASAIPPVLWALDETANIAPLPQLPAVLADAGGQGLIVLTCLQDLSQARARWGPAADGFLTLHPTTLLMPGVADVATLRAVTLLAGQVDTPHSSLTRSGLWKASTTTSTRRLPRLPEDVVAAGRAGEALRLAGTRPSRLRLTPAHQCAWVAEILAR